MRRHQLRDVELRSYQREALEWADERESGVICQPTGSGKTVVGAGWACRVLDEPDKHRLLVITPARLLAEQFAKELSELTTIPTETLYGTTAPEHRENLWGNGTAVVTTAHAAVRDLEHLDFDAVIVDECHHAVGDHATARLLEALDVDRRLGLSATVPPGRQRAVEELIGPVKRWSYRDLPAEHVSEWIGTVRDVTYPSPYENARDTLEELRREHRGTQLAGLASLGIGMLSRHGALALEETLENGTVMGECFGDELTPQLARCQPAHKFEQCQRVLDGQDFEKAIVFVDRVAVAEHLCSRLDGYRTVQLVGRQRSSHAEQERVLERAGNEDTDVIVATRAGEEGVDLPAVDLLVVWSNTPAMIRFVQRLGRMMRPTGREAPRAVFLATPDSPDYEALRTGIREAHSAGFELSGIDAQDLLSGSPVSRVTEVLAEGPASRQALFDTLGATETKLDSWLTEALEAGEVIYLYEEPDALAARQSRGIGMLTEFTDIDPSEEDIGLRYTEDLQFEEQDRVYCRHADVPRLREERPDLFGDHEDVLLRVSYGPSADDHDRRTTGSPRSCAESMLEELDGLDRFHAHVRVESVSPEFGFQLYYSAIASEVAIRAVCDNVAALSARIEDRIRAEVT